MENDFDDEARGDKTPLFKMVQVPCIQKRPISNHGRVQPQIEVPIAILEEDAEIAIDSGHASLAGKSKDHDALPLARVPDVLRHEISSLGMLPRCKENAIVVRDDKGRADPVWATVEFDAAK